mmetsp:Transcript_57355/g.161995  ORF Transcript_57355/g.161995 Transcript_57355/m.161995 type:complete len:296 (-) Transcript_57355:142-1029(-)
MIAATFRQVLLAMCALAVGSTAFIVQTPHLRLRRPRLVDTLSRRSRGPGTRAVARPRPRRGRPPLAAVSMSAVEEARRSAKPALEHAFSLEQPPRAITVIDEWAAKVAEALEAEPLIENAYNRTTRGRIPHTKSQHALLYSHENLNFMRLYIRSHMRVHVFGITVDGTMGGIQALAMVSSGAFQDNSAGQLHHLAQQHGFVSGEAGGIVDAVEVIAFSMKPGADYGRGVRQQLIRRINNVALASGHLLTYNPAGPVANAFSSDLKFAKIKERKPFRVYTDSAWVNENYHLVGLAV